MLIVIRVVYGATYHDYLIVLQNSFTHSSPMQRGPGKHRLAPCLLLCPHSQAEPARQMVSVELGVLWEAHCLFLSLTCSVTSGMSLGHALASGFHSLMLWMALPTCFSPFLGSHVA